MNRKKIIYSIAGLILAAFLLYHSVYFASLEEHRQELAGQVFDPTEAIGQFWEEGPAKLITEALPLEDFEKGLTANPQKMAQDYGKTLGIGAPYSFLVKGKARIKEVKAEEICLDIPGNIPYSIRTNFIFSNTVREASGYFDLDKFETTMEFNLVAMELNNHITQKVIGPVLPQLKPNAVVEFLGATDVNIKHLPATFVEMIPIQLNITEP